MKYEIKKAVPCYTGGNIYVFTGELDGTWFVADDGFYDVRIIDVNPNDYDWDEEVWQFDWQTEHLVKDLSPDESVEFFKQMLAWVILNQPKGNYLIQDMEADMVEVITELKGAWR